MISPPYFYSALAQLIAVIIPFKTGERNAAEGKKIVKMKINSKSKFSGGGRLTLQNCCYMLYKGKFAEGKEWFLIWLLLRSGRPS